MARIKRRKGISPNKKAAQRKKYFRFMVMYAKEWLKVITGKIDLINKNNA